MESDKSHLDITRPLVANIENLHYITREISTYNSDKSFQFSLLNAQSICTKDEIVHHHMVPEKIDALLVTET